MGSFCIGLKQRISRIFCRRFANSFNFVGPIRLSVKRLKVSYREQPSQQHIKTQVKIQVKIRTEIVENVLLCRPEGIKYPMCASTINAVSSGFGKANDYEASSLGIPGQYLYDGRPKGVHIY
jgi:hypothetical protein